jgi:uncharacterized membrane protein YphA (DoxX/SURF4 family)
MIDRPFAPSIEARSRIGTLSRQVSHLSELYQLYACSADRLTFIGTSLLPASLYHGLLTRVAALGIAITMIVAMLTAHLKYGCS